MKKLSTISLFVFGVVVTAILTAGLVFYQNSKNTSSKNNIIVQEAILKNGIPVVNTQNNTSVTMQKSLTLNMPEILKHNSQTDCWMLISGKVYDITSFFGSHPGGNGTMAATCGTDATSAYDTKDPNATSSSNGNGHSSRAKNLLINYYLGNLNQTIIQ